MIPVTVERNDNPPVPKPNQNFHYVDQGNYRICQLSSGLALYSDSATSCIIVVVLAGKGVEQWVALAHLDSPSCIQAFFSILSDKGFDFLQIYAQGANPPDNQTAKENAEQLQLSIESLGTLVVAKELFLLEGNPRERNLGDFGVHCVGERAVVTNQPYALSLTDRDPTCGGQTVYCIMRRQEHPPIEIRDAAVPFTHAELVELSSIALQFRKTPSDPTTAFTNIVNMQSEAIRAMWSTTPKYEADWFSDQLKAVLTAKVDQICRDDQIRAYRSEVDALKTQNRILTLKLE